MDCIFSFQLYWYHVLQVITLRPQVAAAPAAAAAASTRVLSPAAPPLPLLQAAQAPETIVSPFRIIPKVEYRWLIVS